MRVSISPLVLVMESSNDIVTYSITYTFVSFRYFIDVWTF